MRKCLLILLTSFLPFISCRKEVISTLVNDTGSIHYCEASKVALGVEVGEIYNSQNFAAFTDVAYYNGLWYATFRVGTAHVGGENGQIKILTSANSEKWTVEKIFAINDLDLREGKFVIDSLNNNLYLNFWGRKQVRYRQMTRENYLTKFDKSVNEWESPQEIEYDHANGEFIFWRLTYSKGNMYCAAYHGPVRANNNVSLFVNDKTFTKYKLLGKFNLNDTATETTLRFNGNDSIYLIARTEAGFSPIGITLPVNCKNTSWIKDPLLKISASPNFLFYKNQLLITGRDSYGKFTLFCYDLTLKKIQKTFTFPSCNETGYGGMSFNPFNGNELWITYYCIGDSGSSIKLAKINLPEFL